MPNIFSSDKLKIFNGSVLKMIAVISMLIDHTAFLLADEIPGFAVPLLAIGGREITLYYIFRKIGRLAFPIFCFLAAEGFFYTRNQKRYAGNLLLFALLSEIPFNLMKSGRFLFPSGQNVFFTLFFGVLLLYIFKNVKNETAKLVAMLGVAVIAILAKADYGLPGVLLILLLFVLRELPAVRTILAYPLLSGGWAAFCAFLPIHMYNGKRGFIKSGLLKYAFYLFYPLHICILVIIKLLLRQ